MQDLLTNVTDKLSSWGETFFAMLPNLAVALLIVVIAYFLSVLAAKISDGALGRVNVHKAARRLMATGVKLTVIGAGVVIALGVLGLDKALTSILAGAGVVGLALGFAFQDLASNLISGVGLAVNRGLPYSIGDMVETNDTLGTVEAINLRTSLIRTLTGQVAVIPNKQIYQTKIVNWSENGTVRVDVDCGVSYGDDLDEVKEVATKALEGLSVRVESKPIQVFFKEFGDSSINFTARFWVNYENHADYLGARSEAVIALKSAFDKNDIMIPFPIRTLDFGIRGGEPLKESLPGFSKPASAASLASD